MNKKVKLSRFKNWTGNRMVKEHSVFGHNYVRKLNGSCIWKSGIGTKTNVRMFVISYNVERGYQKFS